MDWDTPWKEVLHKFLSWVLAMMMPDLHGEIDWTRDTEHLETEIRPLLPESATRHKRIDVLVKLWMKGNRGAFALLHAEAQMHKEKRGRFPRRMYEYSSTTEIHLGEEVTSLAILGDRSPDWRPCRYVYERWGTKKTLTYRVCKLLDYRGKEEELEKGDNPFGPFIVAHLVSQTTKKTDQARADDKLRLVRNYLARTMSQSDRQGWLRLLDWLLPLTADLHRVFRSEVLLSLKEVAVPFVSWLEQDKLDAVSKALEEAAKNSDKAVSKAVNTKELAVRREMVRDLLLERFPNERAEVLPRIDALESVSLLKQLQVAVALKSFADVVELLG